MDNQEKITDKNSWNRIVHAKRFLDAFRGLYVLGKTTRHLLIHIVVGVVVIFLGFHFRISSLEWVALIFSIGFVLVSEAFNTAIEIDIDLTSPEYHPYARDTKDVAAAAVLLSVFTSILIGLVIFIPKI